MAFPLNTDTVARAHWIQAVLWKAVNTQFRALSLHPYRGFLVTYSIRDSDQFGDFCANTPIEMMLTNAHGKTVHANISAKL